MVTHAKAKGSFRIYATFSDDLDMDLGDGVRITIPHSTSITKKFEMTGEFSQGVDVLKELQQKLTHFLDKLVLCQGIPVEGLEPLGLQIFSDTSTQTTSTRHIEVTGAIAVDVTQMNKLETLLASTVNKEILRLYAIAVNKDSYEAFWAIYNLLLVIYGKEGKSLDRHIRTEFPGKLPLVNSDFYSMIGKDPKTTLIVAIRDSLSHRKGSTYNGVRLNIDAEINTNLPKFRAFVREVLVKELDLQSVCV